MLKQRIARLTMMALLLVWTPVVLSDVEEPEEEWGIPFQALWQAILNLQEQISQIELIPGPPGPEGPQGPQGEPGVVEVPVELVHSGPEPTISATNAGEGKAGYFDGNVEITGDLVVGGSITGDLEIESVHVSQITGLLGDGYTLRFPDIINNLAEVEIGEVLLTERVVVIHGPGYDTERIEGFGEYGNPLDTPGLSMEHPLIIETSGDDAEALKTYFDNYAAGLVSETFASLIVRNLVGTEVFRWNFYDLKPESYEPSIDGRTRFTFVVNAIPDTTLHSEEALPAPPAISSWGDGISFNPAADKRVEISGVEDFFPEVEVDEPNRTVTLTYDFAEGQGIWPWVRQTVKFGSAAISSMSIIEGGVVGDPYNEDSRMNYFECFPVQYEIFTGFGLDTKLKARVVVAYSLAEAAG